MDQGIGEDLWRRYCWTDDNGMSDDDDDDLSFTRCVSPPPWPIYLLKKLGVCVMMSMNHGLILREFHVCYF
jgi:hypothetical protein